MKDFERLKKECMEEVADIGIEIGNIKEWKINTRARSMWGQCKKNTDGTYSIQIADRLLRDDRISEKACKETMIHELLHTCKEGMKHTGKWKVYAREMNEEYGYNIKRTTSGNEKGIENYKPKSLAVKYVFTCGGCGATIYRKRMSKFTKYYRNYRCTRCGAVDWRRKRQNMETWYYTVVSIDGDYANLKRTDIESEDLKLVARALLPEGIREGTQLKYELMQYSILD